MRIELQSRTGILKQDLQALHKSAIIADEMTKGIIRKLTAELYEGIKTEVQVVYLMAGLRKLLEKQQLKEKYEYLTLHANWTLHSRLTGPTAQKLLKQFHAANIKLRGGMELRNLPSDLRAEVNRISKLTAFREEISDFLTANGLPRLETTRQDAWPHFLHLYAMVVEDSPLVMTAKDGSIDNVTVHMELANQPIETEMPYKITWTVLEKNGRSGNIYVINSFSFSQLSG